MSFYFLLPSVRTTSLEHIPRPRTTVLQSIMAARTTVLRLLTSKAPPLSTTAALSKRALFTSQAQKYYHSSPPWQADVSSQQGPQSQSPLAASVKAAASPPGDKAQASRQSKGEDENRNAAFLGEADSDDGFEADVEAYPDAHRHRLESVEASGMHGQSGTWPSLPRTSNQLTDRAKPCYPGESDAVYAPPRPQVALDGSNSAYLGEADSNDAHGKPSALPKTRHSPSGGHSIHLSTPTSH